MADVRKVLIVEDDKVLVGMYKTLLENHGFTVLTAEDGETGLFKAVEQKPDLILLDIRMPKMDGLTMMENLRRNEWGSTVPIIIFTNLDTNEDILVKVVKNMPTYYLVKSNTKPEMVLEKVQEVLEHTEDGQNTSS
jgi:DNA-binding response OmpR family regulator